MKMEPQEMLRIFVPSLTIDNQTCLLLGSKNRKQNLCCVTCYLQLHKTDVNILRSLFSKQDCAASIIGIYVNKREGYDPNKLEFCYSLLAQLPEWISLTTYDAELPKCVAHGNWKGPDSKLNFTMVIFNAQDLHTSCILENLNPRTNLGQLHDEWNKGISFMKEETTMCHVESFVAVQPTQIEYCYHTAFEYLTRCCLLITSLLMQICDNRLFHYFSMSDFLPKPAVLLQLQKKTRDLHTAIIQHRTSKLNTLRLTHVFWRQALDILLGVAVMCFLGCHSKYLADILMYSAETVASNLQQLLQWMMGVPAGLKLNDELAHFLGQFFYYHIYLWMGYLRFLEPLWTDAVWYISLSGCFGLSIQLSLVQDLLSMMTLHSYCFYVYAARLYSLQVSALSSLWRLFRGKKWNPLFQRVDSSSYDVDQLFIGTLLFTILLFLLPTTGLFYVVFTGLRLLVLAIQGTLYKFVNHLDSLPIYAIYLRVVTSSRVAADIRLHVFPRNPCQPLYHAIELLPVSMMRLFLLLDAATISKQAVTYTWGSFLQKIVTGKLIFPWIEPIN